MKVLRAESQPEVGEEDGIGEGLGSALYIVKVCRVIVVHLSLTGG